MTLPLVSKFFSRLTWRRRQELKDVDATSRAACVEHDAIQGCVPRPSKQRMVEGVAHQTVVTGHYQQHAHHADHHDNRRPLTLRPRRRLVERHGGAAATEDAVVMVRHGAVIEHL